MPAPKLEGHAHAEAFHCLPEKLTLVDDVASPFYDARVRKPVPEWLVESILALEQVIEPVVCVRDGGRLVIDDGRQRQRACIEANRRRAKAGKPPLHVTYVVKRPLDGDAGIIGLARAANTRVEDSPIERAEAAARLFATCQAGGMTDPEAKRFTATRCGVSGTTIDNWLALLGCSTAVRKAVDAGQVAATVGGELAKLPRDQQVAALEEMLAKGVTKGSSARRAVAAAKKGQPIQPKTAKRMRNQSEVQSYVDALAGRLLKAEGRAVLAALRYVLRQADATEQCDDLAEVLDESVSAKQAAHG